MRRNVLRIVVYLNGRNLGSRHTSSHPAILGLPVIKRRFADPVLPANLGRLQSGLALLQNGHNLLFRKPRSLHPSPFPRGFLPAGKLSFHTDSFTAATSRSLWMC